MLIARTCLIVLLLKAVPVMAYLIEDAPSPVVHEDGTVSFVIVAAQADTVTVAGNLAVEPVPMSVDTSGTWSVTVGPLKPGIYFYDFVVDGLHVLDQTNPWTHKFLGGGTSVVLVPTSPPAFYEEQDVPRGTVHLQRQRSRALDDWRGYEVYTPPGYDNENDRRYPVLYLLHGYTDTEASWRTSGRAGVILDNLIAEGAAEPMIVVMPFGYAPPEAEDAEGDGPDAWARWFARVTPRFERYLLDELIPRIDADYRTRADDRHRAIAGLSMGGGQSLQIGLGHINTFSWIGAFSAAVFEPVHDPLISRPDALNQHLSLLWIGCGRDDFLYELNARFLSQLDSLGVEHTAHISAGAHSWPVWHRYLHRLLPLLFR